MQGAPLKLGDLSVDGADSVRPRVAGFRLRSGLVARGRSEQHRETRGERPRRRPRGRARRAGMAGAASSAAPHACRTAARAQRRPGSGPVRSRVTSQTGGVHDAHGLHKIHVYKESSGAENGCTRLPACESLAVVFLSVE